MSSLVTTQLHKLHARKPEKDSIPCLKPSSFSDTNDTMQLDKIFIDATMNGWNDTMQQV